MGGIRLTALAGLLLASTAHAEETPKQAPPPLEAYGDLPAVEQMALAAGGKGLAVVARVLGERRLLVLDEAQAVKAVMPLGDTKLRELAWCDTRTVCATVSKTERLGMDFNIDRYEAYYTVVLPLDGGKLRWLFKDAHWVAPAIMGNYGFRTVGGKRFGYFSALQLRETADRSGYEFDKGQPTLFAVDMATLSFRKIGEATDEGASREWLVGADGQLAARLDYVSNTGSWTIRSKSGLTLAHSMDKLADVGFVALGKDGTSLVYWRRDSADALIKWFEVPLAGGAESELAPGIAVRKPFIDPDDGRMLGYLPEDGEGTGKPVLFDAALEAKLRAVYRAFAKLDVEVVDFSKGLAQVLVKTSGNGDPGTYYLVDLAARRADPVGNERPAIAPEMVGPISTVSYKSGDGLEMDGVLTLPPGRAAKNLPVVLMPHGGPFGVEDRAGFDWWAQALASRGYAVFQPNFRGSGHRSDAFEKAGHGQYGRKMQTDISDGLAELARQGIVDPRRACIVGASYGGYAALAGVTLQKGLYRCAVAVAPVSDLAEKYETNLHDSGYNETRRRNLLEELGPTSGYAAVSPRRHAANADAPVMIIHGRDDTRVPFEQGKRMADALRDAKKPVEFIELPKEDHFLSRPETRKLMLASCVRFVIANNPPD
jgi:dienelactone hydrolase